MKRPDLLAWAVAIFPALAFCGLVLLMLDGNFGCHFPMFEVRA